MWASDTDSFLPGSAAFENTFLKRSEQTERNEYMVRKVPSKGKIIVSVDGNPNVGKNTNIGSNVQGTLNKNWPF